MELVIPNGRLFSTRFDDGFVWLWIKISLLKDDPERWVSPPQLVLSGHGKNIQGWAQSGILTDKRTEWEPRGNPEHSLRFNDLADTLCILFSQRMRSISAQCLVMGISHMDSQLLRFQIVTGTLKNDRYSHASLQVVRVHFAVWPVKVKLEHDKHSDASFEVRCNSNLSMVY